MTPPASDAPAAAAVVEVTPFPLDDERAVPAAAGWEWLDAGERERAERFRFAVHRERFIRGRAVLRLILARRLGREPASLRFGAGAQGKPFLEGGGLHFNLSHSEDRAAVAVSALPDIGIDLERFDRKVDIEGLGRRCFREPELDLLAGLSGGERVRAFFWLWTAKEARMKATGEGFRLPPRSIEIAFEAGLPARCLAPPGPEFHLAAVAPPGGDTACTVAAPGPFRVALGEFRGIGEQ